MLHTEIAIVDDVLRAHAALISRDLTAYRNHVYRVANVCFALSSAAEGERADRVAVAAVFHDIGIWTAGTFDYLEPSVSAAVAYLAHAGRSDLAPEIAAMIREHHRIRPSRSRPDWLVEPFRRADWVDVSRGALTFGLSRGFLATLSSTWPNAGFHALLVRLSLDRWRKHPWSPLPMLRL